MGLSWRSKSRCLRGVGERRATAEELDRARLERVGRTIKIWMEEELWGRIVGETKGRGFLAEESRRRVAEVALECFVWLARSRLPGCKKDFTEHSGRFDQMLSNICLWTLTLDLGEKMVAKGEKVRRCLTKRQRWLNAC